MVKIMDVVCDALSSLGSTHKWTPLEVLKVQVQCDVAIGNNDIHDEIERWRVATARG